MRHKTVLLVCLLVLGLVALAPAGATAGEKRTDGRDDDCDCDALAAALNAIDVEIDDLESTLDEYRSQLSIPGKIATSLEGYGVRAVEGSCNDGEGRVGLEGGWRLCFPIASSADVIPFITDFLEQLGYDPKAFREAADNVDSVEDALDRARGDRERILKDCARCRCECA